MPPEVETVSQAEVLIRLQFRELAPVFVSVRVCGAPLKGPPANPLAVNPAAGVITKGSDWATNALIRLVPMGVPMPQTKS